MRWFKIHLKKFSSRQSEIQVQFPENNLSSLIQTLDSIYHKIFQNQNNINLNDFYSRQLFYELQMLIVFHENIV